MWQRTGGQEGSPQKTSSAACGTQYLSQGRWPQATARIQPTQGARSRGSRSPHSQALGLGRGVDFWGLQPNASGEGGSKGEEEWGFHGLGVMRSEFRTGSGSRKRTEENREPRRGKRMSLTFTLPAGRWVRNALGWCFIACGSREKGH